MSYEMGRYALDGFSDLIETIDNVENSEMNKQQFVRILLTKYDARNKVINEWVFDQLEPFNRQNYSIIKWIAGSI